MDPCDSELLRVSSRGQRRPRAVEEPDVEAMVFAAQAEPTGRQQMFWPVRDVAVLRFLAGTGARAEEICGATIGEIDRRPERPIWRVGRSKGGKQRDVPLRQDTVKALDEWLAARTAHFPGRAPGRPAPLFVRTDGTALTERTLDRLRGQSRCALASGCRRMPPRTLSVTTTASPSRCAGSRRQRSAS